MNKYTSKNTSVNSKRTPKGFSLLYPYGKVLDYGCGKYWKISEEYCKKCGAEYNKYDPYNVKEEDNADIGKRNIYDTIYCNNVLNVLSDAYEVIETIENISELLTTGGKAIFTIYEGDKSGIGKETKEDCWQRNMKTKSYHWFFEYAQTKNCAVKITTNYIMMKKLTRQELKEISDIITLDIEVPF